MRRALRRSAGSLLVAGMLLLLFLMPAHVAGHAAPSIAEQVDRTTAEPGDVDPPPLDLAEAQRVLLTEQVYRAPGSIARFDEDRVLDRLDADTRILLAPFTGLDRQGGHYDEVRRPLSDWASDQGLRLVLVTGLDVRLMPNGGKAAATELDGLLLRYAHHDVTGPLLLSLRHLEDGTTESDDAEPVRVPADPAQVTEIVDTLRRGEVYHAPGVDAPIRPSEDWAAVVPDLTIRVAQLPASPAADGLPDLLPELAAVFPDDLVVVVHGRWLEAAGPEQQQIDSARFYTFGLWESGFAFWGAPMGALIDQFLLRLGELRVGEPFGRPQVEPILTRELWERIAPWVFSLTALAVGGGSLLWWARSVARRRNAEASALRLLRAQALAEITRLGARLVTVDVPASDADGTARRIADAAERHATARDLLEDTTSSDVVREVLAVAADGHGLLDAADRRRGSDRG
ncbi:hypothetical protein FHR81_004982 [Actinoalloteichus hoggarensis]|uniref:Uncharacterized protein n=1 Tax=Actinoalloteichus hoggarensis TaxID=1470176 RepID=A0A221W7P4_9PSEU|nr:hypothetical protein [Actinoalloteichus hoggarensis]ASO22010.1 hypothetical protein AHOG_21970 [Actinoalloteichus hoggarensis]MBB5923909.1 hypothetical protein [Actinoalloteichus hoggarensis]